jgi:hypothetical protein
VTLKTAVIRLLCHYTVWLLHHIIIIIIIIIIVVGGDCSVGMATGYGLDDRGSGRSIPGEG